MNNVDLVILEPSETANYVVYDQCTSSSYINYKEDLSLIPASFDQIIKNNVVILEAILP